MEWAPPGPAAGAEWRAIGVHGQHAEKETMSLAAADIACRFAPASEVQREQATLLTDINSRALARCEQQLYRGIATTDHGKMERIHLRS